MISNFSIMSADSDSNKLREACQRFSEDRPDDIITGVMLFGKFATVQVIHGHPITASDVRMTDLGGYWKAGQFQLFSPTELELIDREDDTEQ